MWRVWGIMHHASINTTDIYMRRVYMEYHTSMNTADRAARSLQLACVACVLCVVCCMSHAVRVRACAVCSLAWWHNWCLLEMEMEFKIANCELVMRDAICIYRKFIIY